MDKIPQLLVRVNAMMKKEYKKDFGAFYPLLAISLTAIIICVYGHGWEFYTQRQGQAYFAALSFESDESVESEEVWKPYVDFAALRESNPDVVAWIKCEDMAINYPVAQGTDNAYYLSHLPDGTESAAGAIFLDYRNAPDFTDDNSAIYGHHMRTGDMFTALENYKSQAFYEEHPSLEIYTPEGDYAMELLAGYVVDANWETLPLDFANVADFEKYIAEIRRRSTFASEVAVSPEDRLVSLCTCTYDFSNARLIIVGKLAETER